MTQSGRTDSSGGPEGTVGRRPFADGGESVEAHMSVRARAFEIYDESLGAWVARPGAYTIRAGRSSRDLRLDAQVDLA